jgi:transmembrane sensor
MKLNLRAKCAAAHIEREASLWVIRCERGLNAAEQDEFLQWITADQRHGREYARQRGNWSRLALLADWRPVHSPTPNRDLLAPAPGAKPGWINACRPWLAPLTLAAAASVALGVFFTGTERSASSTLAVPAQIAAIEQRTLPDGSTITLNRGAKVSVHYTASERCVWLTRGEAHFAVAKAPDRPFVVSVAGVDVRAVGTAFNVRLESAAVEVLVTEGRVKMGRRASAVTPGLRATQDTREQGARAWESGEAGGPSVTPGPESRGRGTEEDVPSSVVSGSSSASDPWSEIAAGHRAVQSLAARAAPEIFAVTAEQMGELLAWQPSFLDFTDTPLQSIVAEFNRRNAPVYITIADIELAQTEMSASLRSDNIEGFIRLLEVGFGVEAERLGHAVRLRKAKPERQRAR